MLPVGFDWPTGIFTSQGSHQRQVELDEVSSGAR
jgi:hypothetical protein